MVSLSNHERRDTWRAAAAYTALTVLFTWPLCLGLTRDLAGDFGDPLLNAWILAWDATHLGRGWWNANIFFPHPLTLAYSEHLLPQAISILPVHVIAKNPILNYNLVFFSTFVLSGLGMFLLVREITGNRAAAFLAGVAFAFAPYRVTQIPHVQVLSSQWMPFALYGFRRYFATQGLRPLIGGTAAWIVQNLSCGYYLLFFGPVLAAYLAWEMTARALWREKRAVLSVAAACVIVVAVAFVFARPYLELRDLGFKPRSLQETMTFSADVLAYFTADPNLRLWGPLVKKWPWPEGALFPGVVIVLLAAIGVCAAARPFEVRVRGTAASPAYKSPTLIAFVASVGLVTALLLGYTIRTPILQITSFTRTLVVLAAVWSLVWLRSADTRREVRQWLATPAGFFTLVAVFAIVMSFGPTIHARGRMISRTNLYMLFYTWVPGFDGVRTAARFAMIVTLAVAVLGGIGSAAIARVVGSRALLVLAGVIMLEGIAVPLHLNQNPLHYKRPGLAPLPASVVDVPPIYTFVSTLPPSAAIAELPIGEPAFDVRYMFFSTTHWRPLVNGYSGGGPAAYERLEQTLQDALTRPEPAWQALVASQASHVIVHEAFYAEDRGPRISEWLRSHGAQELAVFGSDRIFRIR